MLLNRPQVATNISQQHFQGTQNLQTRMPAARSAAISEPYEILQQQRFTGKFKNIEFFLYILTFIYINIY